MISDDDVKRLFQNGMRVLANNLSPDEAMFTQFYRGKASHTWEGQPPGDCTRHMSVFDRFNAIPEYCFNCYKVVIKPRTVVELFKLMVVLDNLQLVNDNTRKCLVEGREYVRDTYTGLIYCLGIKEGEELLNTIRKVISDEISDKIPVTLKRGCSEYGLAYPEYTNTENGMEYREEWRAYEELIDKVIDVHSLPKLPDTNNRPAYNRQDAKVMLAWIRYAAMIGDLSYLKISGHPLPPAPYLKRPFPFHPPDDE